MNTFFAVALTLALCAVTFAQDPCDAQCAGVCSAGAALCIDIPSVVDCGALTAACTGVCKDTCTCTGACTASCASDAKACEEVCQHFHQPELQGCPADHEPPSSSTRRQVGNEILNYPGHSNVDDPWH